MAFQEACQKLADSLSAADPSKAILDYLLENAVGRKNAKSWTKIRAHLSAQGVTNIPSKENFQIGLLGKTRETDAFIGSGRLGFFIIAERDDAYFTRDFYIKRITVQASRLDKLQKLIEKEFPCKLPLKSRRTKREVLG